VSIIEFKRPEPSISHFCLYCPCKPGGHEMSAYFELNNEGIHIVELKCSRCGEIRPIKDGILTLNGK